MHREPRAGARRDDGQATGADSAFRRLFFGKVNPIAEQPESILYFYLTSPRVAAPRWYHEGIAVFVEPGWPAASAARRAATTRWSSARWSRTARASTTRSGSCREGTKIDFQVEANSYLYGARFMTGWPTVLAREADRVGDAAARQPRRTTRRSSSRCSASRSSRPGRTGSRSNRTFQQTNLAAIRKYPITPATDLSPRALGSVSRAYLRRGVRTHLRGSELSRRRRACRRDRDDPAGRSSISSTSRARRSTRSRRCARTSPARRSSTRPTTAPIATSCGSTSTTRRTRVLQKDVRIGDLALNRADRVALGRPAPATASHRSCRWRRRTREWTRVVSLPYGTVVYDLDVSPDGTHAVGVGRRSERPAERARVSIASLRSGDTTPVAEFDFGGRRSRTASSSRRTAGFCTAARTSPASRTSSGTSWRRRSSRRSRTPRPASSGRFRSADDELIVFRYTGEGFVPARV